MAEFGDFSTGVAVSDDAVTVDMCDYGYVDGCNDQKKLNGILNLLRSGKEGFYPDLLKYTEDKLFTLMTPAEQQRILRLKTQASPLDIVEAESGLTAWEGKIQNTDRLLSNKLNYSTKGASDEVLLRKSPPLKTKKLPPVRGGAAVISVSTEDNNTEKHDKSEDLAHRLRISEREKQKGNESYRVGDINEAIMCYSRSIEMDPKNPILYANRAMGYLKIESLEKAEEDCNIALEYDCTYVKAWSRRGLTRFKRGKYSESASDFFHAMKLDPGNKELQTLLQKSKDKFLEVEGKGEWREDSVPLESSGPGPDSASDSIFITVPVKKESERDFLSFSSNFSCLEIMNEGKYFERNISVSSNKHESRVGKDGEKEREKVKEIGTEIATNSEQESEFTRVVISFDDDDEDDDDDEGKVEKDLKTSVEGEIVLLTQIHDNNDFTRIEITEGGSDSDEDEDKEDNEVERKSELKVGDMSVGYDNLKGKNVEEKVISKEEMETSSFTRIVIEDEDEDEDNGNEKDQQILVEKDEIVTTVEKNEAHARTNLDSKVEKTVVHEVISTNAATSLIKQDNNKLKSDVDTKNITEKTATTDVDRKRKSEELKLAGNEEMKNMNYLSALSLYTQSLELDQSNLLTRNNRSQAYLKLNQFKESVNDATYILENDPTYPKSGTLDNGISSVPSSAQSDPVSSTVKKAIFRRATAYSGMGGDNLALSLKDFDLLLTIEPKNTIAHNDRKKTAQLTREYEKNKRVESASGFLVSGNKSSSSSFAEIPRSTKSVSSGNGSGSGVTSSPGPGNGSGSVGEGAVMLEKSSRRLTPSSSSLPVPVSTSTSSFASSLSSNPPPPPTATSTSAAVSTNIIATPENSLSTTRKSATIPEKSVSISTLPNPIKVNKRDPVIPSEIPKTLYELERAWRGLKDRPDLFGKYLKQNMTKKSTVKKVFKEAISPELLSSVFISLRDYCSADVILTVLGGMTLLSHFSMTLALFPEEDLNCLKSIFTKILDVEDIGESKRNSALTLKEMFKM